MTPTKKAKTSKKGRTGKKLILPTEVVEQISRPGIRRLAFRAGVKTVSNLVFDEIRQSMVSRLTAVLSKSMTYTRDARRKTVSLGDILNGLEDDGSRVAFGFVDAKGRSYVPPSHINFTRYSHRVLKVVHPDTGITAKSASQINALIFYIGKDIAARASKLILQSGKATVTARAIQNAIRSLIPGQLGNHADSEGLKAVTKYNTSIEEKAEKSEGGTKITKSSRAGLQFPPDRVKRFFKGGTQEQKFLGRTSLKTSDPAMVYFAAVLEYLVAEIMELSGNVAKGHKLQRITSRHIFLAVAPDEELSKLLETTGIRMGSSGVLPNIHPVLLEKKAKVKSQASSGQRRFRPGTVSLRLIRKYQKTTTTLLQREPFKRLVRAIADDISIVEDQKFSAGAFDVLLDDLEARIVSLLEKANLIAIHRGEVTVMAKDVVVVKKLEV